MEAWGWQKNTYKNQSDFLFLPKIYLLEIIQEIKSILQIIFEP